MTFKQKIVQQHLVLLQDKIDVFRDMISGLAEDAQNDAKGSAGDKHETALSMMHLEQEKLSAKLQEALQMKTILEKIDATATTSKIAVGSVIKTNGMFLFMSAALPKIAIDGVNVIALSPQSPLGLKLMGGGIGETFEINSSKYTIETID